MNQIEATRLWRDICSTELGVCGHEVITRTNPLGNVAMANALPMGIFAYKENHWEQKRNLVSAWLRKWADEIDDGPHDTRD